MLSLNLLSACAWILLLRRALATPLPDDLQTRGGSGPYQLVSLRIEGLTSTIYEAPIISNPRNVTTASGGTHLCNGQNLDANPQPGATPTTALDAASKLPKFGFPFDGTFQTQFDDFFITSIGDSTNNDDQFWGLLVNFQFTPVGGCQFETKTNDKVLWAFDAFNAQYFLELSGPKAGVKGEELEVRVVDGTTGTPVEGASVGGATTNATGYASITPAKIGLLQLKATKTGSVRSNRLDVIVA